MLVVQDFWITLYSPEVAKEMVRGSQISSQGIFKIKHYLEKIQRKGKKLGYDIDQGAGSAVHPLPPCVVLQNE